MGHLSATPDVINYKAPWTLPTRAICTVMGLRVDPQPLARASPHLPDYMKETWIALEND